MATTNEVKYPGAATVTGTVTASLTGNVTGNASGSSSTATNTAYATDAGSATNAAYATSAGAADTVAFTDRDTQNETNYVAFTLGHTPGQRSLYTDENLTYNPATAYINANVAQTANATNIGGLAVNDTGTANTIAARTATDGDLKTRLFRSSYTNQNTISGAIAYRVSTNDNYIRFCSNMGSVRTYLDVPSTNGGDASGTWSINVNGSAANAAYATTAGSTTNVTYATTVGSATHANAANAVAFTDRDSSNNTDYIAFVDSHAAGDKALFTDSNLTYNSSTNHINANVPYANNAGNLGGIAGSVNSAVNTVVIRHSSGHIYMNYGFAAYLNMSHGAGTRNGDTVFYSSYDNYIRKNAAGNFRSSLDVPTRTGGNAGGTWSINVNGSGKVNGNISYTLKCNANSGTAFAAYGLRAAAYPYTSGGPVAGNVGYPNTGSLVARSFDYGLRTTSGMISHAGFWAYSDRRIKENITTIDTKEALSKVNKLKPVGYIRKDNRRHDLGFIAQEVQEEIPEAVKMTSGYVGDICEYGTISDKKLFGVADEDNPTTAYQYTFTTFAPLPETIDTSNAFVFQIEYRPDGTIDDGINAETIDAVYNPENCGEVEGDGTIFKFIVEESATDIIDENEDGVFRIFGTLKYDFLALCPSEIVSLVTASVQEVDKQRLQDLERLNELQAKYEEFTKRVDTLRGN